MSTENSISDSVPEESTQIIPINFENSYAMHASKRTAMARMSSENDVNKTQELNDSNEPNEQEWMSRADRSTERENIFNVPMNVTSKTRWA